MKYCVFDSGVIVTAMAERSSASRQLLRRVADQKMVPLLSTPLLCDYEAALKMPEQRLAHGLSLDEVDAFLAGFASAAEPVDVTFLWRPQMKDPYDELILEAAVNGSAEIIVTHAVPKFAPIAALFDIAVLRPADYITALAPLG